jgi:peptidylprolyl isomerase
VIELRHLRAPLAVALAAIAVAGCGSDKTSSTGGSASPATASTPAPAAPKNPALSKKPKVKVPSGPAPAQLEVHDLITGSGPEAALGDQLTVQYVGVLYKNGKQFDTSWGKGKPFTLQLGAGGVIPGWDQGLVGMQAGGRRELVIPPELAYGAQGSPPTIGPNEPLVFVIDLEKIG